MYDPVFSVADRNVVITGACGLIGRKLVTSFVERGARVASVDITPTETREHRPALDGQVIELRADVTKSSEVKQLVSDVVGKFGRIDVLVNSHHYKPKGFTDARAETFPEELWDNILEVNLKATFLTCRDVGRVMLDQGHGSIINFASTYGVVSSDPSLYEGNSLGNPVAYSASKGAVIMLT
jgi:NAD(P)-dependent dehydrogenase (short-subunit alcohol dehydrogenase family)